MYEFGESSLKRLNTCHKDLIDIAKNTIEISHIDFSITEGERSLERQKKLFDEGKSQIDGINKKGKHNYSPSKAFDISIWIPGRRDLAYDKEHLTYVAGLLMATAKFMLLNEMIKHELTWGGNWDRDGIILLDQNLHDRPHFQIED